MIANYLKKLKSIITFTILIFLSYIFVSEAFSQNNTKENLFIPVTEKILILDENIPLIFRDNMRLWFDNRIKVDGIEGKLTIEFNNYIEKITNIDKGKRVDTSLSFTVFLENVSKNDTQSINGNISTYGVIEGNFSLSEFDKLIIKTQKDLINIFASKMKEYF